MILTCPECATSYFVDDSRISPAGRTVKCTSCGARWTATKDPAADEPLSPPSSQPAAVPESSTEDSTSADDLEVMVVDPPPVAPKVEARPAAAKREAAGKVLVWAGSAAVIAALVAAAIAFRGAIVRVWPASQAAYAGVGLPVNSLGLVIEAVRAEPSFAGGRPVLAVSGIVRNVRETPAGAPAIRIRLLDSAGKPVAEKIARPLNASVPGGAQRHFAIAIFDPPAGIRDLEVRFDGQASAPVPRAAKAVLAPAPPEAQPLPPGTPDALPDHG
jgi:predicted Zn finger-like uncharacterized protein